MTLLEAFGGRGIGRCRACQLAAMRVAGYSVEEMRKETGPTAEIIEEFFRWWDDQRQSQVSKQPPPWGENERSEGRAERVKPQASPAAAGGLGGTPHLDRSVKMPRLTEETKQAIIAERESTGATYEQLAEKFGTTSRTVCKIINGDEPAQKPAKKPKAEDEVIRSVRERLLSIYEGLDSEQMRIWEMGEIFAEVSRND
jgi:ribosome-binding protein aMBF1 (putative translation factor)